MRSYRAEKISLLRPVAACAALVLALGAAAPARAGGCVAGQGSDQDRAAACSERLADSALAKAQQADAHIVRGWAFSQLGRWGEARLDYDAAVKLAPESTIAFNERGLMKLRTGRLPDALADYRRALALRPDAPFSLYGVGLTKIRLGDVAAGEADLAAARRIDPAVDKIFHDIGVTQ